MYDSKILRRALIDSILRGIGLPGIGDAAEKLRESRSSVELVVEARRGSVFSEEGYRRLLELVKGYPVEVKRVEVGEWGWRLPEPRIVVGGLISRRLVFYGVPSDVLLSPFYMALAAAGGVWRPSPPPRCPEGRVLLYVVPGLPCTKALYYSLPVVIHCPGAELWVVDAEEAIGQGYGIPSNSVPAFITPRGSLRLLVPEDTASALKAWLG